MGALIQPITKGIDIDYVMEGIFLPTVGETKVHHYLLIAYNNKSNEGPSCLLVGFDKKLDQTEVFPESIFSKEHPLMKVINLREGRKIYINDGGINLDIHHEDEHILNKDYQILKTNSPTYSRTLEDTACDDKIKTASLIKIVSRTEGNYISGLHFISENNKELFEFSTPFFTSLVLNFHKLVDSPPYPFNLYNTTYASNDGKKIPYDVIFAVQSSDKLFDSHNENPWHTEEYAFDAERTLDKRVVYYMMKDFFEPMDRVVLIRRN